MYNPVKEEISSVILKSMSSAIPNITACLLRTVEKQAVDLPFPICVLQTIGGLKGTLAFLGNRFHLRPWRPVRNPNCCSIDQGYAWINPRSWNETRREDFIT